MNTLPHLVHVRPSFAHGGAETRVAQLINHTREKFRHSLIVLDGNFAALHLLRDPDSVHRATCPNTRDPLQMIWRFRGLFRSLRPDLVLTYNWGAIDAAAAARTLPGTPLIHTEDGFDVDEVSGQKRRRVYMRRAVLSGAYCSVAPSQTLVEIMRGAWKLPAKKIRYIPNGVDTIRFQPAPRAPGDEIIIGTVGNLTAVKRQSLLLDVFSRLARQSRVRLMIAGQGPFGPQLEQQAHALGIADRVHFLGYQAEVAKVYAKFDVFVLSSATEQMPISVLEAMACGLPVASTNVGDIRAMVASENQPLIAAEDRLESNLRSLIEDAALRRRLGSANREHCVRVYSMDRMCAEYLTLYEAAILSARNRNVRFSAK